MLAAGEFLTSWQRCIHPVIRSCHRMDARAVDKTLLWPAAPVRENLADGGFVSP